MPPYLLFRGAPKELADNQRSYDFLRRQDGYFVSVRVETVGDPDANSRGSCCRFDDCLQRLNSVCAGEVIHVSKIGLEDLVEFRGATFSVLSGFYLLRRGEEPPTGRDRRAALHTPGSHAARV